MAQQEITGINYRDLLLRYMGNVINVEGYSFLDYLPAETDRSIPVFTVQEIIELEKIETEVREKYKDL